ncbi:MAG: hypothetical protein JW795_02540 [Chitinivibrionales bacterium]|nr:hypothetical protein [Chitinivibrionales bacterium]
MKRKLQFIVELKALNPPCITLVMVCFLMFGSGVNGSTIRLDKNRGTITVNTADVSVTQLFEEIRLQTGLRISIPDSADKLVSVNLRECPISEMMQTIFDGEKIPYVMQYENDMILHPHSASFDEKGISRVLADSGEIESKLKSDKRSGTRGLGVYKSRSAYASAGTASDPRRYHEKGDRKGRAVTDKKEKPRVQNEGDDRYMRLHCMIKPQGMSIESAAILPGTCELTQSPVSEYVYTVQENDSIIAMEALNNPFEMHVLLKDSSKPDTVVAIDSAYINITYPLPKKQVRGGQDVTISVYKLNSVETRFISPEQFQNKRGAAQPLFTIGGEELRNCLNKFIDN